MKYFLLSFTSSVFATYTSLLANLDTTAKPCNDFYRFACGNWGKNKENLASDGTLYKDPLVMAEKKLADILPLVLKGNKKPTSFASVIENQNYENMVNFYNACVSSDSFGTAGNHNGTHTGEIKDDETFHYDIF